MSRTHRWIVLVMVLAAAGCTTAAPTVLFPKAIITREHVQQAAQIEAQFARRYVTTAPAGEPWFKAQPGTSKVLVVAGHATAQTREGRIKEADAGTGSLAVMLNELAGCPILYTTHLSPSDPNYYDDNEFKATLTKIIREHKPVLVLDLHMSDAPRPYDVDFGTMGGASLRGHSNYLRPLAVCLRNEGVTNLSQDFFAASKNATVTKWVSGLGVPCIQVEINSTCLLPTSAPTAERPEGQVVPVEAQPMQYHRFGQLLQALVRFVQAVDLEAPVKH